MSDHQEKSRHRTCCYASQMYDHLFNRILRLTWFLVSPPCLLSTSDHPEEEFRELLDALLSVARAHGAVLTPQEEFHLSLSQTVVLRHHWIQPFTQSLRAGLVHCKRFAQIPPHRVIQSYNILLICSSFSRFLRYR